MNLTAKAERPEPEPMTLDQFRDGIEDLLARYTMNDPAHFVHWTLAAGGLSLLHPDATTVLVTSAQYQATYVTEGLLNNALDKCRGIGFECDCDE